MNDRRYQRLPDARKRPCSSRAIRRALEVNRQSAHPVAWPNSPIGNSGNSRAAGRNGDIALTPKEADAFWQELQRGLQSRRRAAATARLATSSHGRNARDHHGTPGHAGIPPTARRELHRACASIPTGPPLHAAMDSVVVEAHPLKKSRVGPFVDSALARWSRQGDRILNCGVDLKVAPVCC